jgi:hypothetical protein
MAIDLAKLVVKLEAQSAQYLSALEKAEKKLDSFGKKSELSLRKVTKATVALGLGVAAALGKVGLSAAKSIDELGKMSQKTGVSTEALSQLAYAANISDVGIETLQKTMNKLSKASVDASTGSKELQKAFATIGVAVKENDGSLKGTDKLLLELADRFSEFEDGPGKAALALKILGKAGVDMIPFLNQGSEAIRALMKEGDQFGQTITDKAAKAADEFNDNLEKLGIVAKGVVSQAIQELLPTLTALSGELVDGAKNSEEFNRNVEVMLNLFKLIVSGGIVVKAVLFSVGSALGTLAAATAAAFKGVEAKDFLIPGRLLFKLAGNAKDTAGALGTLRDGFTDIADAAQRDIARLDTVWNGPQEKLEEVIVTVKKIKKELKFEDTKLAEAIEKDAAKALAKLEEMSAELQQQVATFDQGAVAVAEYSLNFGKLAEEVGKAGEKGQLLRESILGATIELERLKNVNALQQIDIDLLQLTGHFREAAAAAFDLQNQALKTSLEETGDTAGLEKLDRLRELTLAQSEFNELQREAQILQDKLSRQEQAIQNEVVVGAGTELEALQKTGAAREATVEQLNLILEKMKLIAAASANPELLNNVASFEQEVENLNATVDLLGQKIKGEVKSSVAGLFQDLITGSKSAEDAVLSFLQNIGSRFAAMVAENWAEQLLGSFGSGASGGGGGSGGFWTTVASALFGGSMDAGGKGQSGKAYMIGTGAQPEMFVPGMSGQFIPRAQWQGGGGVTNHFSIQAPQGTVSRATELQIAAAAARGVSQANRRNN